MDHLAVESATDESSSHHYWRWALIILVVIGLGYGGMMMWQVYQETTFVEGVDQDVPVIKAQEGPFKVQPTDPGGKTIPYQDMMVLERVLKDKIDENTTVERLLPEPEQLLPKPHPLADKDVDKFKSEAAAETKETLETKKEDVAAIPTESSIEAEPKVEPSMDKLLADLAQSADKSKSSSKYRLQLTSFKDPTAVEQEWQRLKQNHGDLLQVYQHQVVKVDLGEKGVYYRLMVENFQSLEEAQTLSTKLSKRNVQNILVKP